MKSPTNNTVQALLLILILGFYAWSLGKDVVTPKRWQLKQANATRENLRLVYGQPVGVDIYGNFHAMFSFKAKKNIVFLLRYENLQNDLNFWRRVGIILDSHREIELIGYCDSQQCVESIRKQAPLAFPVLASGEAASIQAVVNADGKAILQNVGSHSSSTMVWRAAESSPQTFAQEASR